MFKKINEIAKKYSDKLLHFCVAYILSDILLEFGAWIKIVIIIIFLISVLKENIDRKKTGFDYIDICSAMAGSFLACSVEYILTYVIT